MGSVLQEPKVVEIPESLKEGEPKLPKPRKKKNAQNIRHKAGRCWMFEVASRPPPPIWTRHASGRENATWLSLKPRSLSLCLDPLARSLFSLMSRMCLYINGFNSFTFSASHSTSPKGMRRVTTQTAHIHMAVRSCMIMTRNESPRKKSRRRCNTLLHRTCSSLSVGPIDRACRALPATTERDPSKGNRGPASLGELHHRASGCGHPW